MTKKNKLYFFVGTKKYEYNLTLKGKDEDGNEIVHVFCESVAIDQDFLAEDIPALILDLPNLFEAEQKYQAQKDKKIYIRVSGREKVDIEKKAFEKGYKSVSTYLRDMALSS